MSGPQITGWCLIRMVRTMQESQVQENGLNGGVDGGRVLVGGEWERGGGEQGRGGGEAVARLAQDGQVV